MVLYGLGGCSHATAPATADLSLAFAARTALVNDPVVGAAAVNVMVFQGVATLTGLVASDDERQRVVALVRGVPGLLGVEDRLSVSTDATVSQPPLPARPGTLPSIEPDPPGRHFALGAGFAWPTQPSDTLDASWSLGPTFRFGRGGGLHPSFSWTRVQSDLPPVVADGKPFGALRMSALTAGLGYAVTGDRWSFDPSVSVGYSFNHVRLDPGLSAPRRDGFPVAASGSPALLLKATVWFEATGRLSVGFSSGYLLTRPGATWLQGDLFTRQRLDADSWLTGVSVAYWVF